jgi:UMF1 family MFS transporter
MLITAAIFAASSAPTFLFLRERARPSVGPRAQSAGTALAGLKRTLRDVVTYIDLRRFLACVVFYQAGIQAVIALAAVYAQEAMGFKTRDTIALILVVNLTAAAGAFAFGYVQDRLGHVRTLALTLAGWIAAVALAYFARGPALFWAAANLVGVCLGASQSAGRALVGYLSPAARSAEFFGLWGLAVKLSAVLGPLTYGLVTWASGGEHRLALAGTGVYLAIGLAILARVDVARGRLLALAGAPGAT